MENLSISVQQSSNNTNMKRFLIGEEAPYLYSLSDIIIKEDSLAIDNINIPNYQFINYGKIIQVACSIGSASIFNALGLQERTYFLIEKCSVRRVSYSNTEGNLFLKANTIATSSRKGKALVDIFDETGLLKYRSEQECTIISENMFSKLFKAHQNNETIGNYSDVMPAFNNIYIGKNEFRIAIEGFSMEQCAGHFPGHPIVPGCFIVNCILSSVKDWLKTEGIEAISLHVENSEAFINKAVPVRTPINAEISVKRVQAKVYLFTAEIKDEAGNHYGFYLNTIQIV